MNTRLKESIKFTLQCLIAIIIALEISLPPNPYARYLIILLVLYICLKNNIVERTMELYNKISTLIKMADSSQKWNPRDNNKLNEDENVIDEKSEEDLKDEIDKYLKNDQGKI